MIIDEMADRLGNMTPILASMGEYMKVSIEVNFIREESPDGTPWAPLKPATLKRKKTTRKLFETGALKNNMGAEIAGDSVKIGPSSGLPYENIHQLGGTAGNGAKIPARPYVGVRQDDPITLAVMLKNYIVEGKL